MKAKKLSHLSDTQIIMLALKELLKRSQFHSRNELLKELEERGEEWRMHIHMSERLKYYNDGRTNIT